MKTKIFISMMGLTLTAFSFASKGCGTIGRTGGTGAGTGYRSSVEGVSSGRNTPSGAAGSKIGGGVGIGRTGGSGIGPGPKPESKGTGGTGN